MGRGRWKPARFLALDLLHTEHMVLSLKKPTPVRLLGLCWGQHRPSPPSPASQQALCYAHARQLQTTTHCIPEEPSHHPVQRGDSRLCDSHVIVSERGSQQAQVLAMDDPHPDQQTAEDDDGDEDDEGNVNSIDKRADGTTLATLATFLATVLLDVGHTARPPCRLIGPPSVAVKRCAGAAKPHGEMGGQAGQAPSTPSCFLCLNSQPASHPATRTHHTHTHTYYVHTPTHTHMHTHKLRQYLLQSSSSCLALGIQRGGPAPRKEGAWQSDTSAFPLAS